MDGFTGIMVCGCRCGADNYIKEEPKMKVYVIQIKPAIYFMKKISIKDHALYYTLYLHVNNNKKLIINCYYYQYQQQ